MMMFDDTVGGLVNGAGYMMMWSKKYKEMPIISIKTYLKYIYPFEDITDQFN